MQYREIVAVTGMSGLFHLQATKADGAIVRSLADNSTKFIPARLHNVTPLESIEVYTNGANVRLHEVLQAMKESSVALPDAKKGADASVRSYFKEVYPDLDDSRVYTSDLKKMVKWFELLKSADLLDFSAMNAPAEEDANEEAGEAASQGAVEDPSTSSLEAEAQLAEESKGDETGMAGLAEEGGAPAKKSRAKKGAEPAAEEGEEKPVKKAAPRKKKAEGEGAEGEDESASKKTARKKKGDDEEAA